LSNYAILKIFKEVSELNWEIVLADLITSATILIWKVNLILYIKKYKDCGGSKELLIKYMDIWIV